MEQQEISSEVFGNQKDVEQLVFKRYATCVVAYTEAKTYILLVKRHDQPLRGRFGFITESLEQTGSKSTYMGAAAAGLQEELSITTSSEQLTPLAAPLGQEVFEMHPVLNALIKKVRMLLSPTLITTQPFLVMLDKKPTIQPNNKEISAVEWVPLDELENVLKQRELLPGTWQTFELLKKTVPALQRSVL